MKKKLLGLLLVVSLIVNLMGAATLGEATMTMPAALTTIEEEAFCGNTSIGKIVLPENIRTIESRAFAGSSLTEAYLPATLTQIAADAFEDCEGFCAIVDYGSYAHEWCVETQTQYTFGNPSELAVKQSGTDLVVSFASPAGPAAYELFWKGPGAEEFAAVATPETLTATEFTVALDALAEGGIHQFKVRGVTEAGTPTAFSEPVEFRALSAPVFTRAYQSGDTDFRLEWNAVEGATGYVVCDVSSGEILPLGNPITKTAYTVALGDDADREATYIYSVYACSGADSTFSVGPMSDAVTFEGLQEIVGTQIVLSDSTVTLTRENKTATLGVEVVSPDGSAMDYSFSVNDGGIASVTNAGVITGRAEGVTYVVVTAEDGTTAKCRVNVDFEDIPVSLAVVEDSIANGSSATLEITFDDGHTADGEDLLLSVSYLNADGVVLAGRQYWLDATEDNHSIYLSCTGAVSAVVSVDQDGDYIPGANPYDTVALSTATGVSYSASIDGFALPGETVRISLSVTNPSALSAAREIRIESEDGLINQSLGSVSKDNAVAAADVVIPETWKLNDNTDDTRYRIRFYVDNTLITTYMFRLYIMDIGQVNVRVGGTASGYYEILADEMPYTFSIADPTIASINAEGVITGLAVGSTTATLTTKNGFPVTFDVNVLEASQTEITEKPAFYIYAPKTRVTFGEDDDIFAIHPEKETSSSVRTNIVLRFYDESGNLLRSEYEEYSVGAYGSTLWPNWEYWQSNCSKAIATIEAEIVGGGDRYEIVDPAIARVEVLHDETGKPQYEISRRQDRVYAGQSAEITVTCLTPELLNEPVTLSVASDDVGVFSEVIPAVISSDNPVGTIRFSVSEDIMPGSWISAYVYAGIECIDSFGMDVYDGVSVALTSLRAGVGDTCRILYEITDPDVNVYFVCADPEIATVDQQGNITAHKVGDTSIKLHVRNKYGYTNTHYIYLSVYPVAQSRPVVTLAMTQESIEFGKPICYNISMDEAVSDDELDLNMFIRVHYFDANKNRIDYDYTDVEFTSSAAAAEGGIDLEYTRWNYDAEWIYDVAYILLVPGCQGETEDLQLVYDNTFVPVVNVPDPEELVYGMSLSSSTSSSIRLGETIYMEVWRNRANIGNSVQVRVEDADGNVLRTSVMEDGATTRHMYFSSSTLTPLEDNTLLLYVGDSTEPAASITLYIDEPRLNTNSVVRMAIGSQMAYEYSFAVDYSCTLTFASDAASVASVDSEGMLTANSVGQAVITVTTPGGQVAKTTVFVYNPEDMQAPELYISSGMESAEWMGDVVFTIGTDTPLYNISSDVEARVYFEFLNAEGEVVYDSRDNGRYWEEECSFAAPTVSVEWSDSDIWKKGFGADADSVRFVLEAADDGSYTVDAQRSFFSLDLPDTAEHPYPYVELEYPTTINSNEPFYVIFRCLNPASLGEGGREVEIRYDNSTLAYGILTEDAPECTLSCAIPEGFMYYDYFLASYPSFEWAGSTESVWISVEINEMNLGSVRKIETGDTVWISPEFDGESQPLTYSSMDESIATVQAYDDYDAIVTGVSAGRTTIVATTQTGSTISVDVIVYDPETASLPVLTLVQPQSNAQVGWDQNEISLRIATSTDPETTVPLERVRYRMEYIDAEGNVVGAVKRGTFWPDDDFVDFNYIDLEHYVSQSDLSSAYANGARSVRYTLEESQNDEYVLGEENLSVTYSLADPSGYSENPLFGVTYPAYMIPGETYEVEIICLNAAALPGTVPFTVESNGMDSFETTFSKDSSSLSCTITAPQDDARSVYIRIECDLDDYWYYNSFSCPVLYGSMSDAYLSVGSTRSMNASVSQEISGLTIEYTSSNTAVATVDSSGTLTGVAPGYTTITATYGPISFSSSVRVYSQDATGNITVYLEEDPEKTPDALKPGSSLYFTIGTDADPADMRAYCSANYICEYLDADGDVVWTDNSGYSLWLYFYGPTESEYVYFSHDAILDAVMAGATAVRITLTGSSNVSVDADRASITVPFADASEWSLSGNFGVGIPAAVSAGENISIPVQLFTYEDDSTAYTCEMTFSDSSGNTLAEMSRNINSENPTTVFAFAVPEDTSYVYVNYEICDSYGSTRRSGSKSIGVVSVTNIQSDTVIEVGSSFTASYNVTNIHTITPVYLSSNSAVATVSSDGLVTGVSQGIAEITARFGSLSYSFTVRVSDPTLSEVAKLSLNIVDEIDVWPWTDSVRMSISADQPVEKLGTSRVTVYAVADFLDASGNWICENSNYCIIRFVDNNVYEFTARMPEDVIREAIIGGAVSVKLYLTNMGYTEDYTISTDEVITLPMGDRSELTDPYLYVDSSSVDFVKVVEGLSYAVDVCAANANAQGTWELKAYTYVNDERVDLNATTITPSEAETAEVEFTIPLDLTDSYITLYFSATDADGNEKVLFHQGFTLLKIPETVYVSTLNKLQSKHDYDNDANQAWVFTYDSAVSMDVSFAYDTSTADSSDVISVGTLEELNVLSFQNSYTGYNLSGATVTVEGDTLAIWLKTNSYYTDWGFKVSQIVVTLADGSTVTLLPENAKLTLGAPEEAEKWTLETPMVLTLSADLPFEELSSSADEVCCVVNYCDASGNSVASEEMNVETLFTDSNVLEFEFASSLAAIRDIVDGDAVTAEVCLDYLVNGGYGFEIDSDSPTLTFPLQDMSEISSPLFYVDSDELDGSSVATGMEYSVNVYAINSYAEGTWNLEVVNGANVLGTLEATLDGTDVFPVSFMLPAEYSNSYVELSVVAYPAGGSAADAQTLYEGSLNVVTLPPIVYAKGIADLQSEHNYQNNTDQAWVFTYDSAVSMDVIFSEQCYTESGYDYVRVGTLENLYSLDFPYSYSGSDLAGSTVTIDGDTLAIWFTSDYSNTGWGFMVEKIIVTLEDGSTMTLEVKSAELTLGAAEGTDEWPLDAPVMLTLTADLPAEELSTAEELAGFYVQYLDENGEEVFYDELRAPIVFDGSNVMTFGVQSDASLLSGTWRSGVVSVSISLTECVYGGRGYTVHADSPTLTFPLQDPSESTAPLFYVETSELDSMQLFTGAEASMNIYALCPNAEGVWTLEISIEGEVVGSVEVTLGETNVFVLPFTVPADVSGYVGYEVVARPANGSEEDEDLIHEAGMSIIDLSNTVFATDVEQLESAHNYGNNADQAWVFTYDSAVSMDVIFSDQCSTENNYDYVSVGTLDELCSGTFQNTFCGTQLAGETVSIEGDTLAIKLTSDGSVTSWGFKVDQIIVTLADGSTVTLPLPKVLPKLTLGTAETLEVWPLLDGAVLTLTADAAAEDLTGEFCDAACKAEYLDADGQVVFTDTWYGDGEFNGSNTVECTPVIEVWTIRQAMLGGAETIRIYLEANADDAPAFEVDPESPVLTFPLQDLSEVNNPLFYVDEEAADKLLNLYYGGSFSVDAFVYNPHATGVWNLEVIAAAEEETVRISLGKTEVTLGEATQFAVPFTIPEDFAYADFHMEILGYPADEELDLNNAWIYVGNATVIDLPDIVYATDYTQLQSEHEYANNAYQAWVFTYDSAVSMDVYFNQNCWVEYECDYLSVGTLDELYAGSFANKYTTDELANQIVTIEGDTLAILLESDDTETYWGFKVDKIVVTLEDGSTVVLAPNTALITLGMPDAPEAWLLDTPVKVTLTADIPVEEMSGQEESIVLSVDFLDAEGELWMGDHYYLPMEFGESNVLEYEIEQYPWTLQEVYYSEEVVSAQVFLEGVENGGCGYEPDPESPVFTFTIDRDLENIRHPLFYVDEAEIAEIVANPGETVYLPVHAENPYAVGTWNLRACMGNYDEETDTYVETIFGQTDITLGETTDFEVPFTVPADFQKLRMGFELVARPEGGDEDDDFYFFYDKVWVNGNPEVVYTTDVNDLESTHDYDNEMDKVWVFTYDSAVSLDVTFSASTYTEEYCDYIHVGTVDEAGKYSFTGSYCSDELAGAVVSVEGDTLAIYLETDGSVTEWGFSVVEITATMADGSSVTLPEVSGA